MSSYFWHICIWNKFRRKIYCPPKNFYEPYKLGLITENDEWVQAVYQEYEFTYFDHIFEKK